MNQLSTVTPPSENARAAAQEHLDALAVPRGALGRLGEFGVWLSAVQDQVPPAVPEHVRAVVFAGDHGVAEHAVSAYPREITPMMVRAFVAGTAGVAVLARQHGVALRVLDIAVDADLSDLDVSAYKVRRGSGAIHLEDALTAEELDRSLQVGAAVAAEEIAAGAQMLISGDMGIGNTTPAAALIAASFGLPAELVAGRGTGVDDAGLAHKTAIIAEALARHADDGDPRRTLAALGSADIAASAGFMAAAARAGVPVVLDGLISVAAAVMADRLAPGAAAWFVAGHRSTEPAQSLALEKLGLSPILDLDLRLGEGSGAVAAVPLLRSAALLLSEVARLDAL
ncbi:nicotinate-nucleotide--dimethylbenzimidazole phosphoribosyltransferase [uncultured Aeromicrobium sp.]|uniref:nicotinate-nucleotide--dimethylbenzimidazole phosphoribosyltransferase n=1 Tax=uncultured Aeromicrobium sp. TaxID=337820 RepID=UPI0025D296EC|nr:nicotinate-nucleotide--dimethylbenzimidazole phosphoribosyltransferase [uncultured Aeromicrobium sp.]